MLRFTVAQTMTFRIIDGTMENLKVKVSAVLNLSIPLDRAHRVVLETLIGTFETDSWTNMGLFYSNMVLTSPTWSTHYLIKKQIYSHKPVSSAYLYLTDVDD